MHFLHLIVSLKHNALSSNYHFFFFFACPFDVTSKNPLPNLRAWGLVTSFLIRIVWDTVWDWAESIDQFGSYCHFTNFKYFNPTNNLVIISFQSLHFSTPDFSIWFIFIIIEPIVWSLSPINLPIHSRLSFITNSIVFEIALEKFSTLLCKWSQFFQEEIRNYLFKVYLSPTQISEPGLWNWRLPSFSLNDAPSCGSGAPSGGWWQKHQVSLSCSSQLGSAASQAGTRETGLSVLSVDHAQGSLHLVHRGWAKAKSSHHFTALIQHVASK